MKITFANGHIAYTDNVNTVIITEKNLIESNFTNNEKTVVSLRLGLDGRGPKSMEETGKIMGITRERVRKIEGNAFRKMRDQLFISSRSISVLTRLNIIKNGIVDKNMLKNLSASTISKAWGCGDKVLNEILEFRKML